MKSTTDHSQSAQKPSLQDTAFQFLKLHCDPRAGQHISGVRGEKGMSNLIFLRKLLEHFPFEHDVSGADDLKAQFIPLLRTLEYYHGLSSNANMARYLDDAHRAKLSNPGHEPSRTDIGRLELADEFLAKVKNCFEEAYKKDTAYERDTNIENALFEAGKSFDESPEVFVKIIKDRLFAHLDLEHARAVLERVIERLRREPGVWDEANHLNERLIAVMAEHPEAKHMAIGDAVTRSSVIHSAQLIRPVAAEYLKQDFAASMDKLIKEIAPVVEAAAAQRNANRGPD